MDSCPFCRIVAGDGDAHVLLETEETTAFLDANPAVTGHTLVVPNEHHVELFAEAPTTVGDVFRSVRRVVRAMNRTLAPDGVSVFYTTGDLAGRVTHAHVHLLPRYLDDDIHLALARAELDDAAAASLASEIRAAV